MAEALNFIEATPDKTLHIKDGPAVTEILELLKLKVTNGEKIVKKYDDYLATFNKKAGLGESAVIANRDLMDVKKGLGSELIRKLDLTPKTQNALSNRPDASQEAVTAAIQKNKQDTVNLASPQKSTISPPTAQNNGWREGLMGLMKKANSAHGADKI